VSHATIFRSFATTFAASGTFSLLRLALSSQSLCTFFTSLRHSASESPCAKHPFKAGTSATYPPSSAGYITIGLEDMMAIGNSVERALHKSRLLSRRSRRLTIAQHFSAGRSEPTSLQSVKRTAEFEEFSVVRFADSFAVGVLIPALKCWAIVSSSRVAGLYSYFFLCKACRAQNPPAKVMSVCRQTSLREGCSSDVQAV
jgi:hypothetical protein